MATKISISKINTPKNLLSKLPRFSIDLRFNNTKIVMLYTPITETLMRVWKEKTGIVATAKKQFSEFEKASIKNKKKPASKKISKK